MCFFPRQKTHRGCLLQKAITTYSAVALEAEKSRLLIWWRMPIVGSNPTR